MSSENCNQSLQTSTPIMRLFCLFLLPTLSLAQPWGPVGPPGTKLVYDLLQPMSGGTLGAFKAVHWTHAYNNERQQYRPWMAKQDSNSKQITITSKKGSDGRIYSARLESYKIWSTSKSWRTKKRGYVEVRSTMPAKTNDNWRYKGSWPAIWMLGTGNGAGWPKPGEIDIIEIVNGQPKLASATHSKSRNGGNPQHPPNNGKHINADLTRDPLICGVEWNIHGSQIDLTFWFSWKDLGSGQWQKHHTTLVLGAWGNQDYWDFYHSFMGEGFSLLINLAQGGDMPQTQEVLVDGQPQHMVVQSAKVYGF